MMSSVKLSLYFTRHNQSNTKGPFVDINGSWHSFLKPSRIHSTHGSPAGLGSLAGHIFWYHVKLYQPLHSSRLLYIHIFIYIYDIIHASVHVPFHVLKHLTCHYTCPHPEPRRCADCGCEHGTMMGRACESCAGVPQLLLMLAHCQYRYACQVYRPKFSACFVHVLKEDMRLYCTCCLNMSSLHALTILQWLHDHAQTQSCGIAHPKPQADKHVLCAAVL